LFLHGSTPPAMQLEQGKNVVTNQLRHNPMNTRTSVRLLSAVGAILLSFHASGALPDGLVAYWPLNSSPDGTTTPDMTPNGNTLTLNGSTLPTFVPGQFGNAIQLNGVDQYLSLTYTVGTDTGLPIYNAGYYTVCLWVRDNKYSSGTNQLNRTVFSEASTVNNNALLQLRTDWNGTASARTNLFAALLDDDGGTTFFGNQTFGDLGKTTGNPSVPFDGSWHHVAWVDSNGVARVYIDGVLDPKIFHTKILEPVNGNAGTMTLNTLALGAVLKAAGASSFFAGQLDDVAVWARTLSKAEIDQVRTTGIPTPISTALPSIVNQPVGNTSLVTNDNWSLKAFALGTHPISYQWCSNGVPLVDDGINVGGSTNQILSLTNLPAGYSGNYTVVITNLYGSYTSSPAAVLVNTVTPQAPNLTNSQIAYWPLDTIQGGTTPDVVGGYDMFVNNTGSGLISTTGGKFSSAMNFTGGNSCLVRIFSPGDRLPLYQYPEFTMAMWVNAPTPASNPGGTGMRFMTMGNSASTAPWLSLANVDTTAQDTLNASLATMRVFSRSDNNQNNAVNGVGVTTLPIFDGTWHHITYVQRVVGGELPVLQGLVYIDGVLNPMITVCSPRLPTTAQIMAIGGSVRNTTTTLGTSGTRAAMIGSMDDVAVWNRALTPLEIYMLTTNTVPPAPSTLPALAVTSFKADFAETVNGDSAVLRWIISGSPLSVKINGTDVTSLTTNGIGNMAISSVTATTNFTLIASRAGTSVTNTTGIAAVNGISAGWHVLDDFQTYAVGPLVNPYWADLNSGSQVVSVGGKNMLDTTATAAAQGQVAVLPLSSFTLAQGQTRTIFARIYVADDPGAATFQNTIGVTDKAMKDARDTGLDTGPVARISTDAGGQLALGGNNDVGATTTLYPVKLDYQQVYNLWIDVTNGTFYTNLVAGTTNAGDIYSIWMQRLGTSNRQLIVSNFWTDRDLQPDFLGGGDNPVNLTELILGTANSSGSVYFTDIYLSSSGYNSTVPVAWSGSTPPALSQPNLTADFKSTPGTVNFTWDVGALMSAPAVPGPWSVVPDSIGFSYSVLIDPTVPQRYFRVQR
jgi:hypothetical protein